MSENIDEYLRANWGKKSREGMRKQLGITDGELIWHVGRLGLPFGGTHGYGQSYIVYPDGHCMLPKALCEQLNLMPGMRVNYEVVSNEPREKVVKITVFASTVQPAVMDESGGE